MAKKSTKNLRGMSDQELQAELLNLKKESFNLRMQAVSGQLENNRRIRTVRKDIARVLTLLGERSNDAE